MADVNTSLEFLADLPMYKSEKPYQIFPHINSGWKAENPALKNMEWQSHNVRIHDMRGVPELDLEKSAFEVVEHVSASVAAWNPDKIPAYLQETETLLERFFGAELIICYDYTLRKNGQVHQEEFDSNDKSLVHGPPRGAHNVTFESAGEAISNVLNESQKKKYLQPGFRFQIVNTWRPLLPKIEDRPLAVCDPRSINLADIFPADKVYPHWLQEIYYLRYNSSQKWYWLPEQTSSQILLMKMFDSKADASAKFCPHISFDNPGKRASAPPRESIETRSLVITKESGFQHVKGS